MNNEIAPITNETINLLLNIINGVLKFDISDILKESLNISDKDKTDGKKVVFQYASAIESKLGKQKSFSTLRQVGKSLAKQLMQKNSKDKWEYLLQYSLRKFGFAQKVQKDEKSAFICNCVFYDMLQKEGLDPTEHSVCWAGWGLIEGFVMEFEDVLSIKWSYRDIENSRCKFDFVR